MFLTLSYNSSVLTNYITSINIKNSPKQLLYIYHLYSILSYLRFPISENLKPPNNRLQHLSAIALVILENSYIWDALELRE